MAEKTIELLSPAGDMERLRMSLAYGADAVYLAGPDFGMRSFAGNFTPEELRQAVELCAAAGEDDAVAVDVAGQLRRSLLQHLMGGGADLLAQAHDRLVEGASA